MYTDPEIVSSNSLNIRAYVKVYIDGKRYRFYNGKQLGIVCNPNYSRSLRDRNKSLAELSYKLRKKLEMGWSPGKNLFHEKSPVKKILAGESIEQLVKELDQQDLSTLYKRDLHIISNQFLNHLKDSKLLLTPLELIDRKIVESFLKSFNHSGTYYMNKRRTLGAIFSRLVKDNMIDRNPVTETPRLREKSTLHKAYTKQQLLVVLTILQNRHYNLYLCALLMYGCLLRPHQEIRNLFRSNFNEDCSTISLDGNCNKSGRIRTVYVPHFVKTELIRLDFQNRDGYINLFTGTCDYYNESYFNTIWSRIKEVLLHQKLIEEDHTLYSFRHTAAVNLYMKTKDLYKVQQAMGHSSMTVTLTYMRSLGLVNNLTAHDAPEL